MVITRGHGKELIQCCRDRRMFVCNHQSTNLPRSRTFNTTPYVFQSRLWSRKRQLRDWTLTVNWRRVGELGSANFARKSWNPGTLPRTTFWPILLSLAVLHVSSVDSVLTARSFSAFTCPMSTETWKNTDVKNEINTLNKHGIMSLSWLLYRMYF